MNSDPVDSIYTNQPSTKKVLCEDIEGYLDWAKQPIDVNNHLHSSGTLDTASLKPAGG